MDDSSLSKLIGNTPLALVVIGLLLLVIGAAGGWPNPPLEVTELSWRMTLAVAGVFVAGFGVISFWGERNYSSKRFSSCAKYGIQIISPRFRERVGHSFPISGTYKKLPKDAAIEIFTVYGEDDNREYWPQAKTTIDIQRKTWHSRVNWLGGEVGDTKEILVFIVGKEGQVLINYYNEVGRATNKWPSLTRFTSDIAKCASVEVILGE